MKLSEEVLEKIGAYQITMNGRSAFLAETMDAIEKIENIYRKANEEMPDIYFDDDVYFCDGCREYHERNMWTISIGEYGEYCAECVEKSKALQEMYIEYLTNNVHNANILKDSILTSAGWKKIEEHSVGMYGYEDNVTPAMILEREKRDVIFSVDNLGNPYSTEYSVWVKDGGNE